MRITTTAITLIITCLYFNTHATDPISAAPFAAGKTEILSENGQKVVAQSHQWHPLIEIPKEKLGNGEIALWVSHRHGAVQLKVMDGKEQREKKWSYHRGSDWKWVMLYRGPVSKLTGNLIIIRDARESSYTTQINQLMLDTSLQWSPTGEVPISQPSGWAPPSWNKLRRKFKETREQDKGSVVFLGDSITKGFKLDQHFPNLKSVNYGITGDLSQNMHLRLVEDVLPLEPKALFLLAGTNDLKDNHPPEKVTQRLMKICDTMHEKNPNTKVFLSLIMPRGAGKNPERVIKANGLIQAAATERKWLTLVGSHKPLATESGEAVAEYFGDGIHPNSKGYTVWADILRPHLEPFFTSTPQ